MHYKDNKILIIAFFLARTVNDYALSVHCIKKEYQNQYTQKLM